MTEATDYLILIVDDTESSVDILVAALGDDYDLAVALDGESAIEVAEEDRPDLILLDIVMPGMDGFEVCDRLKSNPATREIPVMFLSGQSEAADRERAAALGAAGFLSKPVDVPALRRQVSAFLSEHGLRQRGEDD